MRVFTEAQYAEVVAIWKRLGALQHEIELFRDRAETERARTDALLAESDALFAKVRAKFPTVSRASEREDAQATKGKVT